MATVYGPLTVLTLVSPECRLGDLINTWRDSLDLEPISRSEGPCLVEALKIPFTYCWSPSLVPKPADWSDHIGTHFSSSSTPPQFRSH